MVMDSFIQRMGGVCLAVLMLASAAAAQTSTPAGATSTSVPSMTSLLEGGAPASAPATKATTAALTQNWTDFIHYLRIARADAALSYGKAILDSKPDPAEVYRLSVQTENYIETLQRAEKMPGLAETISAIRKLVEEGYKKVNRDPVQIAKAIDMLGGALRQTMIGSDRLLTSGEYAVPQLIAKLENPAATVPQKDQIGFVLAKMGLPAVRPLCAALASPKPEVRIAICQALGKIGYWHAAPYLRRLLAEKDLDAVKAAAESALVMVTTDPAAGKKPVAEYFYLLAEKYYGNPDVPGGEESLRPDSRYDIANVWYWQEGLGLIYKEVPSAIFMDVYAMRSARQALEADANFSPAVSLWLAADLRKESHLKSAADDPTLVPGQQSADAYAKAAGAKYMQDVLARGLRDRDAAVAMGAIRALSGTAGAKNLVMPAAGGVSPLVSALGFPDRRVRYMAAEVLAAARPLEHFQGDEMVVTVLVDALRQTGKPTIMLVVANTDYRNKYKEMIRQSGYDVVDGPALSAGVEAMRQSTGVDLAVLGSDISGPGPEQALSMLRAEGSTAALPVLFVAAESDLSTVRKLAREDKLVSIAEAENLDLGKLQAAIKAAAARGVGNTAMAAGDSAQWALKAAQLVRLLGLTRTPVFDLARTERALVAGLSDKREDQQIACAQALAMLPSGTAQQSIVELARSEAPAGVKIAAYQAASQSVRLIGNQLSEGQSGAIVKVVMSEAAPELRTAASELLGALNLPSEQIKALITTTAGKGE
jgi:HEAT repeat protein